MVVLVHGYPGSGKGTQCALLKEYFGFNHLSVGDLLRTEMKTNTKLGKKIRSYVEDGKILPVEDTLEILKKAMKKRSDVKHFLLDGYPRDKDNLDGWIQFTKDLNITVRCVLRLNCDRKICERRILETEGISNRIDYNKKAVKERFKAYESLMGPIHKFYKHIRKEIDGQGVKGEDTPQEVFKRVLHVVQEEGFRLFSSPDPVSVKEQVEKIERKDSREEHCFARKVGVESDKGISSSEQATLSKPPPSSLKGCEVVLVHGYPAAGKGTQCELLAKNFDFTHISVGVLMRREMQRDNIASAFIKYYVLEGKIVPAKFTCKILQKVMEESKVKRFLIDGYPRDERNLKAWIKFVKENDIKFWFVLLLNCVKETCRKRMFDAGYQRGSRREDDNPATLEKRFEAYETLMEPVHKYYKSNRREVDGEGVKKDDTPEQVFERVKEVFQKEGFEVSTPPEKESLEETKTISRANRTEPDWEKNPFKRAFKK